MQTTHPVIGWSEPLPGRRRQNLLPCGMHSDFQSGGIYHKIFCTWYVSSNPIQSRVRCDCVLVYSSGFGQASLTAAVTAAVGSGTKHAHAFVAHATLSQLQYSILRSTQQAATSMRKAAAAAAATTTSVHLIMRPQLARRR